VIEWRHERALAVDLPPERPLAVAPRAAPAIVVGA
jgi:hypothetical protein